MKIERPEEIYSIPYRTFVYYPILRGMLPLEAFFKVWEIYIYDTLSGRIIKPRSMSLEEDVYDCVESDAAFESGKKVIIYYE